MKHSRMLSSVLASLLLGACTAGAAGEMPGAQIGNPTEMQIGPSAQPNGPQPAFAPVIAYRLRGDASVRPLRVTDDGARTTIAFAPDQALPAVFALGPTGEEIVVNGYMRTGDYVIDRVHERLVFRIDRERATAERQATQRGRR